MAFRQLIEGENVIHHLVGGAQFNVARDHLVAALSHPIEELRHALGRISQPRIINLLALVARVGMSHLPLEAAVLLTEVLPLLLNHKKLFCERLPLLFKFFDVLALARCFFQQFFRGLQLVFKLITARGELRMLVIHRIQAAREGGDTALQLGVRTRIKRRQEAANQAA